VSRDIAWTPAAARDLGRLDRAVAARIIDALVRYAETGQGDVSLLHGPGREWRMRVGDWRVRFEIPDDNAIVVYRVLPRGRAYRN